MYGLIFESSPQGRTNASLALNLNIKEWSLVLAFVVLTGRNLRVNFYSKSIHFYGQRMIELSTVIFDIKMSQLLEIRAGSLYTNKQLHFSLNLLLKTIYLRQRLVARATAHLSNISALNITYFKTLTFINLRYYKLLNFNAYHCERITLNHFMPRYQYFAFH